MVHAMVGSFFEFSRLGLERNLVEFLNFLPAKA